MPRLQVEDDKARILEMIENGPGFHDLNSRVAQCLKLWVADTACAELDKYLATNPPDEEISETLGPVGYTLRWMQLFPKSLQVLLLCR